MNAAHRTALAILLVVVVSWGGAMVWAFGRAERVSGLMLAAFPLDTTATTVLAAVIEADGVVVAPTWLPGAFVVAGVGVDFRQRLRAAGARVVLPAAPFQVLGMGGCGVAFWPRRTTVADAPIP